jgi:hypothetical protein
MSEKLVNLLNDLDLKLDQVNRANTDLRDVIKSILSHVNENKDLQNLDHMAALQNKLGIFNEDSIVRFNVGGQIFSTSKLNITQKIRKPANNDYYEDNQLTRILNGTCEDAKFDKENQAIFIDRNPKYFSYIIDFLRSINENNESNEFDFQLSKLDEDIDGLLREAEYFNIQSLVDLITLRPESNILDSVEFLSLMDLIGFERGSKWRLIYRATTDSFGSDKFHLKCDNIPNTLIIINTVNSYVFGGFSSEAWDESGQYKDDPKSFLFSFINPDNKPLKLNYIGTGKAMYCHANNGPTFGAGMVLLFLYF